MLPDLPFFETFGAFGVALSVVWALMRYLLKDKDRRIEKLEDDLRECEKRNRTLTDERIKEQSAMLRVMEQWKSAINRNTGPSSPSPPI